VSAIITDDERSTIQSVECPLCHAKPGTNCINTGGGGRFTGFIHRERIIAHRIAYEKAKQAGELW
jgi:hypothetical protein